MMLKMAAVLVRRLSNMNSFHELPIISDYLYTPVLSEAIELVTNQNGGCVLPYRCSECVWSDYSGDVSICIPQEFNYLLELLRII